MKILVSGYFSKGNFGDELIFKIFKERFKKDFKYLKTRYNIFKILKECFSRDVLIFPGGGVFQQETGFFSFYYYILLVFIFILRGKKVFLLNQGFGRLGYFEKLLIRDLFKNVEFISVRDISGFSFLKKCGIKPCLSADSSLYICKKVKKKEKRFTLIIPRGDKNLWLKTLRFFSNKLKGDVIIIPFQKKRDLKLARYIKKEVKKGRIFVWKNIDEVIGLFEKAEFVFASCYHAVLLSLIFRVDFIAVYYNEKVKRLLKDFLLLDRLVENDKYFERVKFKKMVAEFDISNIIYRMEERENFCFKEFLRCFHI